MENREEKYRGTSWVRNKRDTFTIYMDDVMEDYEATSRRLRRPARIILGRPHGKAEHLLLATVNAKDHENQQLQEKEITRAVEKYARPP